MGWGINLSNMSELSFSGLYQTEFELINLGWNICVPLNTNISHPRYGELRYFDGEKRYFEDSIDAFPRGWVWKPKHSDLPFYHKWVNVLDAAKDIKCLMEHPSFRRI